MRIAIGQILQESNSFNPVRTGMKELENFGYARGRDVLKKFSQTNEIKGFLDGFKIWEESVEPVPLVRFFGLSGGPLAKETAGRIMMELVETLKSSLPVDGVLLSLHGASMAEGIPDFDGEILEVVRRIIGTKIPVVATLDLHANVTRKMFENADALIPYHTIPHVDLSETGRRAARIIHRILQKKELPVFCRARIPAVVSGENQNVFMPPLKKIFDLIRQAEKEPGIWSVSLCLSQPWLDVAEHCSCAMAIGTNKEKIKDHACKIAWKLWQAKEKLDAVERIKPQEAVSRALSFKGKPVVIADGADATNSGAPGDSTILLKEFLKHKSNKTVLLTVVDPGIAKRAFAAGKGKTIEGKLGGKRDNIFSSPVQFKGKVIELTNGQYSISGHLGENLPVSTGKTALVKIENIFVVVSEYPGPGSHPMVYRSIGLEPKDADIVVVKSPAGFRADYEPFAKKIILSDCPGLASPHYQELPFRNNRKRFYPWEEDFDWFPEAEFK